MIPSIQKSQMTIVVPLIDDGAKRIASRLSFFNGPLSFVACQKIAKFYDQKGVETDLHSSPLGGKSYTWKVNEQSKSYKVFCICNEATLGFGYLGFSLQDDHQKSFRQYFASSSDVHPLTAQVHLKGVLFIDDTLVQLPNPK